TELVDAIPDAPDANGQTRFDQPRVLVRADRDDAQRCKTGLHEIAHIHLHAPDSDGARLDRALKEIEAESCAYVCADSLGLDTGAYSIPYVATWLAGGDPAVLAVTARRVLDAAGHITTSLGDLL